MPTKPQDVVVALKLCFAPPNRSYANLAQSLQMSASEVHGAVRRLVAAHLVEKGSMIVRREALRRFLVYGVPYAFPASVQGPGRGIPTAWAAPVMADMIYSANQPPPVWPDAKGKVQGLLVEPLYASAPQAALNDPQLYGLLALVDALRFGRARERALAEKEIEQQFSVHHDATAN